jgi:hypothetical protein
MQRFPARLAVVGAMVGSLWVSGCSDTVRLPDCVDCRPVEMSVDETLEVELGSDRAVTNDPDAHEWIVAETGTMTLVSAERGTRPEDEDEFVGGYSRYVIYLFEPTAEGTTQIQFQFVPTASTDQPVNALDITVNVNE